MNLSERCYGEVFTLQTTSTEAGPQQSKINSATQIKIRKIGKGQKKTKMNNLAFVMLLNIKWMSLSLDHVKIITYDVRFVVCEQFMIFEDSWIVLHIHASIESLFRRRRRTKKKTIRTMKLQNSRPSKMREKENQTETRNVRRCLRN